MKSQTGATETAPSVATVNFLTDYTVYAGYRSRHCAVLVKERVVPGEGKEE